MMKTAKVIIDSPRTNSSLLYASQYYCFDPFVYLEADGKKIGWLPSTEFESAKKKSKLDKVFNLSETLIQIKEKKGYPLLKSSIIIQWLKKHKINEVLVPEDFPVMEARNFENHDITVIPYEYPFFPARVQKTEIELDYIRENSQKNVKVIDSVYQLLAQSSINNKKQLVFENQLLTSEIIQSYILKQFIDHDLYSDSVIVAVGDQGCDPHENGSGVIKAHTSIIVDIFPRSRSNYYYTDMTRTFCKGKAPDSLKKIYKTVLEGQQLGLDLIHAREDGFSIHKKIQDYFIEKGYQTGIINGVLQGFFHGTGHGLGLDCHEGPYISLNGGILPENSVVSCEPGLYYLGKGAVRIEDLVVVKKDGIENLTNYPKVLEIE